MRSSIFNPHLASLVLGFTTTAAQAAVTNVSFWHYDQAAGSTPYYTHLRVTNDESVPYGASNSMTSQVDLWIFNPTVQTGIEGVTDPSPQSRSTGWHKFEFEFDDSTGSATILLDGALLQSGAFVSPRNYFEFLIHTPFDGAQETAIDDFSVSIDGQVVYFEGFEGGSLAPGWTINRQDPTTYVNWGDGSNPRSGVGSLALGELGGGGDFADASAIVFDLRTVPEPSIAMAALLGAGLLGFRRHRGRASDSLSDGRR